jgi:hypothetical protein
MKNLLRVSLFALVAPLAACGGGGDDGPTLVDADDTTPPDAANTTPDAAPVQCLADDYGTVTPMQQGAQTDNLTTPMYIVYEAGLNADTDVLSVQLYPGFGVFSGGAIAPGTYELTGGETQYETCGACVLVYTNFDGMNTQGTPYLATAGTLTITSVSPNLAGTLSNLTFQSVTILDAAPYTSTPAGDGCTASITSLAFDAPVMVGM